MSKLTLTYSREEGDGVGRIDAKVETIDFSGRGFFWTTRNEIAEFSQKLARFPLDSPCLFVMGFGEVEVTREVISLSIRQATSTGKISVIAKVFNEKGNRSVAVEFFTDYHNISLFGRELEDIVNQGRGIAILEGDFEDLSDVQ